MSAGGGTTGQCDWLNAHGVNLQQGFLYARSLPLAGFVAYLRNGFPEEGEVADEARRSDLAGGGPEGGA